MKIYGIVLAAGFGSRLRPLTERIPKPLLPLCGKTILDLTLDKLFQAGAEKIAVNTHHLGDRILRHLETHPRRKDLKLYQEQEILGTGGPLINARDFLEEADVFLLHNADVVCDFDLRALLEQHLAASNLATMALIDGPENRVLVQDKTILDLVGKCGVTPPADSILKTYACVSAYSPEILRYFPETPRFYSLIDGIADAMRDRSGCVGGYSLPKTTLWNDIGSFEQYFQAHEELLLRGGHLNGIELPDAPRYVAPDASIAPDVRITGFLSAGTGAKVGAGASLSNCILLDGAVVPAGEIRAREIIGKDFSCHRDIRALREISIAGDLNEETTIVSNLAEQGSSRRFYRIRHQGVPGSKVLMISFPEDADFDRFIRIGHFFQEHGLPTPRLEAEDREHLAVLMEDCGNNTIYDLVQTADPESLRALYREIVTTLAEFQVKGTGAIRKESFPIRDFDYDYLRWETQYFQTRFLEQLCAITLSEAERGQIEQEFDLLARTAGAMPQTLMHRDFQCQNILKQSEKIRFVDYQGARIGPYTYDLMSLLKDPYLNLPQELRREMTALHREALIGFGMDLNRSEQEHALDCIAASLQRNMQCLGAYGFLSLVRKKEKYLNFAGPSLDYLLDGLHQLENSGSKLRMPCLTGLCRKAETVLTGAIARARQEINGKGGTHHAG